MIKKRTIHKPRHAFTLIEVAIALSVMVVTAGITIGGFNNYNRRQKVSLAAEELQQIYREARANTAAGKIDCYVCGGANHTCDGWPDDDQLTGWRVLLQDSGNKVVLQGECGSTTKTFMERSSYFAVGVSGVQTALCPTTANGIVFNTSGGTNIASNCQINISGWGYFSNAMVTTEGQVY